MAAIKAEVATYLKPGEGAHRSGHSQAQLATLARWERGRRTEQFYRRDGDHGMGPTSNLPQPSVAKPFNNYLPTTLPGADTSKTDVILTSSEKLLHKIEQNTRGGSGGNTIVNAGQRGGGNQRGSSPNSVATNIATQGAPKLDSRATYLDGLYSITPNTLVS